MIDDSIKPKLAIQCKICKLLKTHKDLWYEIHTKVLKEDYSQVAMCRWLNQQVDSLNSKIENEEDKLPQFSTQNFSHHFKRHITSSMRQELYRQQIMRKDSRLDNQIGFITDEVEFVKEFEEDLVRSQLNDYQSLTQMVHTLENKLYEYDEQFRKKHQENKRRVTLPEIEGYQKQVEALMRLKNELAKLRNSSAVAGVAVENAIEMSVSAFVETMMLITEEAQSMLVTEFPGSGLPDEVIKMIRTKIAEDMKAKVPVIVEKIKGDYKIK